VFDKEVKPRIITFENNKVNVITGSSSTGKSNIYAKIDY
jgi:predicted ATPase